MTIINVFLSGFTILIFEIIILFCPGNDSAIIYIFPQVKAIGQSDYIDKKEVKCAVKVNNYELCVDR